MVDYLLWPLIVTATINIWGFFGGTNELDWLRVSVDIQQTSNEDTQKQTGTTLIQKQDIIIESHRQKEIVIPKRDFFVLIDVSNNREKVYFEGKLLEENLISSGDPQRFGLQAGTPLGKFRIASKIATNPQGEYGPYYLGLEKWENGVFVKSNIGLHGTNEPELLGQDASHGCIRHDNETIARLANLLPIGTMVEIVE